jgi:hypothetical protein
MLKNKFSKLHFGLSRLSSVKRNNYKGGTIINVIVGLVFLGLMAAMILWVMKSWGEAGQEYLTGVKKTEIKATTAACQLHLNQVRTTIQMYAMNNDKMPESFDALVEETGDSKIFRCPEPNSPKYSYIPGQSLDSPPENILVYDSQPVHNGMSNVLRVNGSIESLTPEQLKAAIEKTKTHLKK